MRWRERLSRLGGWPLGLLVPIGAIYGLFTQYYLVGTHYDDGLYLLGARAMAEGLGYVLDFYPGHPPLIKYPPLFSLLMTPVWWAWPQFPQNLPVLMAMQIGFSLLALGSVAWISRSVRRDPSWVTALLILATGLNLHWLRLSTVLMSEPLYCALSITTLAVTLRWFPRTAHPARIQWLTLVALSSLVFYARTVGILLTLAIALWLVQEQGRRQAGQYLLACFLIALPWIAWTAFVQETHPLFQTTTLPGCLAFSFMQSYSEWWHLMVEWLTEPPVGTPWHWLADQLGFLWTRVGVLLASSSGVWNDQALERLVSDGVALGAIGLLLVSVGAWARRAVGGDRTIGLVALYTVLSLVMMVLWPDRLQYVRFMIALLPFWLMQLADGLSWVGHRLTGTKGATVAMAGGLVALIGWNAYRDWALYAGWVVADQWRSASVRYEDYQATFRYIDTHLPEDARLFVWHETMFALYTNRPTVHFFRLPRPVVSARSPLASTNRLACDQGILRQARASYLVDEGAFEFNGFAQPGRFGRPVYTSPFKRVVVYRLDAQAVARSAQQNALIH